MQVPCCLLEQLDSTTAALIDEQPLLIVICELEGPVSARTAAYDLPGDFT